MTGSGFCKKVTYRRTDEGQVYFKKIDIQAAKIKRLQAILDGVRCSCEKCLTVTAS